MPKLAAVFIVSVIAMPTPSEALCVAPVTRPVVLTAEVTLGDGGDGGDGGVVVGTEVGGGGKEQGGAEQPTWMFKVGGKTVKPVISILAPGLVAYKLPDKVARGELVDGTKVLAKITRAPSTPLAAPTASKITYVERPNVRGRSVTTTVELTVAAPAGAIALVIADAKTKQARSFGRVPAGASSVAVYAQGRCSALPNGTIETRPGDSVILRWVDKSGALSAESKPIVVVKA